ncbi:GRAM and VASt domain-containing protein [Aspergillus clavatus NRRL 1]|uniref:GRAM domain protein n=1 Tax=Aspergillus clavatus (strain ATCC 1007 / CBS 513.65 / DSM 816 / NCTC 3887 / NRRL 1 / QM 1276 / 107) TaxID=344612 RepID=A1CA42_ASPCL|nr:GRAM domain protein [Aspergillus clavatus NRRL 1]EAW12610.1 GRAM domain protein [Aspergillus clavatus NRRL 1]
MDEPAIPEPPPVPQSEPQGFSKSNRTWTTPADLETMWSSSRSNGRASISSGSDRPKSQASEAAESTKAGPSGFSKLLNARRRRKKEKEQKQAEELSSALVSENDTDRLHRGPSNESRDGTLLANENSHPASDTMTLLTDDSEPDRTPPLTTRNSHTGFYTSSSPLIKTTSIDPNDIEDMQADVESAVSGPSATASESFADTELSRPATSSGPMLSIPEERGSKKRSVSPGRRLKNAFGGNNEKKDSNRERASSTSGDSKKSGGLLSRRNSLSSKRSQTMAAEPPAALAPILTNVAEDKPLNISDRPNPPRTPPHTAIPAPHTTVTPPTPTNARSEFPKLFSSPDMTESPESVKSRDMPSGVIVSPSGNMISHRRVRSASSASHKPSKLSNSISALSPTIEETKPASRPPSNNQQTGFFSSVFSAAQNAASTLSSSLNPQTKGRTATQPENPGPEGSHPNGTAEESNESRLAEERPVGQRKPSAIDTLGSGDLNFSHLDIDAAPGDAVSTPDGVVITKPDIPPEKRAAYLRDLEAARLEDRHAARAVHMAYEQTSEQPTIQPSDEALELQSSISLSRGEGTGDQTPPSGSIHDGETGTRPYRSGSVRSRLAQRRHRGSSGATTSTAGALGASAITLGAPGANASVPRLTGFAVASKKRNREFHQLFRSVPEDDYLIEDYSCALQREIILAGRIYISEGHICFSSNILGWVTTLVISFDEIVAIEKESTAMVFPNAIAIQTLHARHTFRSLLSRESTYDLMVNIWKINHPALKSSVNGTRVAHGTGDKTEKAGESEVESDDDDEDEIYDEDEDGDNADSVFGAGGASANASERSLPTKGLSRQASGVLSPANGMAPAPAVNSNGESKTSKLAPNGEADADFPGPATHAPTEYTEPNGQYDKLIKDEVIPAPLGKVYSYVFGPASGAFIPKFLVENQKSGELQFESDKKGLTNDSKTRNYSYIKPLNGSIGPKQTKCISTETLDFLDLEKAVLVTLSTQTPDVPSGNVFCTKTKYLFTWASGNQTRFLMTCTIEWSGKSWLKGPIEKGAIDGQTTFGNELVAALKAAVTSRGRGAGATKAGSKGKGKRKKTDSASDDAASAAAKASQNASAAQAKSWGILEPVHGVLGPVADILQPLWNGNIAVVVIGILLFMVFFRTPSQPSRGSHDIGCPGYSLPQRLAAYEEMWRREESELWSWLEDRVGMDGRAFPVASKAPESQMRQTSQQFRNKLRDEKMSDREMNHAIKTTRERLDTLEGILNRRDSQIVADTKTLHQEL